MKLINLLKEDFKYVAWFLLLNVCLALMLVYPFVRIEDALDVDVTGYSRLDRIGPFIYLLYLLSTAILTQRLLGKDCLCDVDAFWLSKPVDGLRLLASKGSILLVVYFVIPWILLWSLANNSGVGMPWGAFVRHAYWTLWFTPALVFFAVHTKGFSTMLVGTTAFAAVMLFGYQFFVHFHIFGGYPAMGGFFHLAAYLVLLLSVSGSIVLLFLNRRLAMSRWIAGIGVFVLIMFTLLGLKGYIGPSDQHIENEAIGRSLVVEEPSFILNSEKGSRRRLTLEKQSLEIDKVPEKFLYFVRRVEVSFGEPENPSAIWMNSQGRGSASSKLLEQALGTVLSELSEWNLQSVLEMSQSSIDVEGDFQNIRTGDLGDPSGSWYVDLNLRRMSIENVEVVPFEDGQAVEFGGIRTVLQQTGSATDYSKYLIVEYSYEDLATNPPIRFYDPESVESLMRFYFLKGKSGRLWKRKYGLYRLNLASAFGLGKRYGNVGIIEPLTEGVDNEELELVVIDVRDLGSIDLKVDARVSLNPR